MKNVFIIGAAFASLALAACGGGGGGGITPTPIQTLQPKPSYSLAIEWQPNTALGTMGVERRSLNQRMDVGINSTTTPIMLTANSPYIGSMADSNDSAAAWITASPQPSPMPTASWSPSSTALAVGVAASPQFPDQVSLQPNTTSAASGSIAAAVGTLGTGTGNWIIYGRLALECHHTAMIPGGDNTPEAYTIKNGTITPASDTTADIYVDGPNCYGTFNNTMETTATLHFPNGISIPAGTQFNTVTASQYASGGTGLSLATSPLPPGVLFKTNDGETVKFGLQFIGNDSTAGPGSWGGPVCILGNGSCPDGT